MDNLDIKILSRLLNNCRESNRQIGIELGMSGGAVRARIQKMEEKKIIEGFSVKVEPTVFGYGVLYFVVSGENINEILAQVSLVGEPYLVVPCVGGVTVCSIVVSENLEQKIDLASKLMKDVRVLSIFKAENPGFNLNLTRTDLEILAELVRNPRQKIERIAQSTSMSAKTVTRCIQKLHENAGIQFTLVYDPKKIEGFIPYVILVWIEGGSLKETLEDMNDAFSESYFQTPFIAKNQAVLFMYSDNIFKMDDLTQRVRTTKNVRSADLFIPKKISFHIRWMETILDDLKTSSRLHPVYHHIK